MTHNAFLKIKNTFFYVELSVIDGIIRDIKNFKRLRNYVADFQAQILR